MKGQGSATDLALSIGLKGNVRDMLIAIWNGRADWAAEAARGAATHGRLILEREGR